MPQNLTVVELTPKTMQVFLSIFGDLAAPDAYRGDRHSPRYSSQAPLEFLRQQGAGAEMCHAKCVDIGEGGLGFLCKESLAPGERVQLYLTGETQVYTVAAEIIHAQTRGSLCRAGAKFLWS